MITLICSIITKDGCKQKFLDALLDMVPQVRQEDGCIAYSGYQDISAEYSTQWFHENRITIVEVWRDEAALRAHWKAPHMSVYREKTRDLVEEKSFSFIEEAKR